MSEAELYQRGYELIGACDISNYLALCQLCPKLIAAIETHHAQKADDRCIDDDDRLYAAAGLPPCDRRVGDKAAMLRNCERFIDRRCEGGGWPTYAELEKQHDAMISVIQKAYRQLCEGSVNDPADTLASFMEAHGIPFGESS